MNKKIFAIGILSMFLLTSIAGLSVATNNQVETKNIETEKEQQDTGGRFLVAKVTLTSGEITHDMPYDVIFSFPKKDGSRFAFIKPYSYEEDKVTILEGGNLHVKCTDKLFGPWDVSLGYGSQLKFRFFIGTYQYKDETSYNIIKMDGTAYFGEVSSSQ